MAKYESGKTYKNRYGDEYVWKKLDENTYEFEMEGDSLKYGRVGARRGQRQLNLNDLDMFDPSGGPFVQVGYAVIDGKTVTNIASSGTSYVVKTTGD